MTCSFLSTGIQKLRQSRSGVARDSVEMQFACVSERALYVAIVSFHTHALNHHHNHNPFPSSFSVLRRTFNLFPVPSLHLSRARTHVRMHDLYAHVPSTYTHEVAHGCLSMTDTTS
jgi:hypothetical protein